MSKHGNMTREQAIEAVGLQLVERLDSEDCDFTGRLQTDGDDSIEFSASIALPEDREDFYTHLFAFYYQSPEAIEAAGEDLSNCDWKISGYEIR